MINEIDFNCIYSEEFKLIDILQKNDINFN